MVLAIAWKSHNNLSDVSAIYFCPILCNMIQSFGSSGEAFFAGAALWIQTLESRAETGKKSKKIKHTNIPRIYLLRDPSSYPHRCRSRQRYDASCLPFHAAFQVRTLEPDFRTSDPLIFSDFFVSNVISAQTRLAMHSFLNRLTNRRGCM